MGTSNTRHATASRQVLLPKPWPHVDALGDHPSQRHEHAVSSKCILKASSKTPSSPHRVTHGSHPTQSAKAPLPARISINSHHARGMSILFHRYASSSPQRMVNGAHPVCGMPRLWWQPYQESRRVQRSWWPPPKRNDHDTPSMCIFKSLSIDQRNTFDTEDCHSSMIPRQNQAVCWRTWCPPGQRKEHGNLSTYLILSSLNDKGAHSTRGMSRLRRQLRSRSQRSRCPPDERHEHDIPLTCILKSSSIC